MAEDGEDIETEDGEEGEAKPKKSLMKMGLFIGLPALIVILGGVAAFLFLSGGSEPEVVEGEHAEGECAEAGDGYGGEGGYGPSADQPVMYFPLNDEHETAILVNIQANGGRSPVLKLELMIEFTDPAVEEALNTHISRVYDQYLVFLRELRVEDLSGSAAAYRLKMELIRRVNLAIDPLHVDDVLIQSMLIQ
jgi:flagellar FliL protein